MNTRIKTVMNLLIFVMILTAAASSLTVHAASLDASEEVSTEEASTEEVSNEETSTEEASTEAVLPDTEASAEVSTESTTEAATESYTVVQLATPADGSGWESDISGTPTRSVVHTIDDLYVELLILLVLLVFYISYRILFDLVRSALKQR